MDESDAGGTADPHVLAGFPARRTLRARRALDQGAIGSSSSADAAAPSHEEPGEVATGGSARQPLPGGRRDRRLQETARIALVAEARDHADGPRADGTDVPFTVDGAILAQQEAIAARAAALTARARGVEDLSEQYRLSRETPAPADPGGEAAPLQNLSIVATRDVGAEPGDTGVLLRAPITSHLPVEGSPAGSPGAADAPGAGTSSPGDPTGPAPTTSVPTTSGPIGARSAFGLDPLDAMTAGLGRARRLRVLQYSLIGVGGAALLTGIMMTVSSLNG